MRRALVLGDASCVHDDADAALKLFTPDAVFAVNNIGRDWPGHVDVWATLHAGRCENWPGIDEALKQRIAAGRNKPEMWGHKARFCIDHVTRDWSGSSGLLAVKIAIEKGFDRIVVAGIPLTIEHAHYYENKRWESAPRFVRGWRRNMPSMRDKVRSMSGWTRDLLGSPTTEWLML